MRGVTTGREADRSAEGAVARPPLVGQGLVGVLLAGVLLLAGVGGTGLLVGAVAVLQVLLLLGFLALVEAPAAGGIFSVVLAGTVAADVVVVTQHGRIGGLAGVVALAFVAGLLHQLARRHRTRVTESLADTVVGITLVCCAACLVAVRELAGDRVLTVALTAAGAALLLGRLGDAVRRRPALAVGATRGWPGLLLALVAGPVGATLAGGGVVAGSRAALLGLAATTVVVATDLAVDLAAADLRVDLAAADLRPGDARRVASLRPVGLLLPLAALGPVAWVGARLVLGTA